MTGAARVKVKVCGVTRIGDAEAVARAGADFIGLNLWRGSKRHVSVEQARELAAAARAARADIAVVGLFVDAPVAEIAAAVTLAGLDVVQLHGDEPPATCGDASRRAGVPVWKAVPVSAPEDVVGLDRWPVDAILLDARTPGRGGSGQTIDWTIAAEAVRGPRSIVLAGGLDPANVARAVAAVRPWAVDVASGVETAPGEKDPARVAAFVAAARGALDPSEDTPKDLPR